MHHGPRQRRIQIRSCRCRNRISVAYSAGWNVQRKLIFRYWPPGSTGAPVDPGYRAAFRCAVCRLVFRARAGPAIQVKRIIGLRIANPPAPKLTCRPVVPIAVDLHAEGRPGRDPHKAQAQFGIDQVEIIMQVAAYRWNIAPRWRTPPPSRVPTRDRFRLPPNHPVQRLRPLREILDRQPVRIEVVGNPLGIV